MRYRLGIVLSGGGSRGLAHAGVLRALTEEGIEPDCISGTSAGALIGALHAAGYGTDDILRFFEETSPFRLSRVALGKPGIIDPEKIAPALREWFPQDSFEALARQLFVTATDLLSGRAEVWSSGPLVSRLLASSAIPFIFTPMRIDGRPYADGGIVDNFPAAPLRERCEVVIGVHATPLSETGDAELDSTFAVTQRALEIGMFHASQRRFHHADLVLTTPELRRYATFDTKRHGEIVELGYQLARDRMKEIRALFENRDDR